MFENLRNDLEAVRNRISSGHQGIVEYALELEQRVSAVENTVTEYEQRIAKLEAVVNAVAAPAPVTEQTTDSVAPTVQG